MPRRSHYYDSTSGKFSTEPSGSYEWMVMPKPGSSWAFGVSHKGLMDKGLVLNLGGREVMLKIAELLTRAAMNELE